MATLSLAVTGGCTLNGEQPPADEQAASEQPGGEHPGAADAPTDASNPFDTDWTAVAQEASGSVVSIAVRGQSGAGEGSGVVIDDDGNVLTNDHVIAPAVGGGEVLVGLSDGRVFPAEVVGADPATDLAVLRADLPDGVEPLEFGDSDAVEVGDPVLALGNPLGLSNTVTLGIVSALDRPVTTQGRGAIEQPIPVVTNAIQTDASVNPGNSGGALIDASGQLIGINSSIATLGTGQGGQGGSIGLGFAIPVSQAQWVAEQLIETGSVDHSFLGVVPASVIVEVNGVGREAAGIQEVLADTPAAQAGLQQGDAVIAVDGETVTGAEALVAQVRERPPGTEVTLTVADPDGETREVLVQFEPRPES